MYFIYSKIDCPACTTAKQLLETNNYEHQVKILDVHYGIIDLYAVAPRNHKSLPMITKAVNGLEEYVGGLSELKVDIEKTI